MKTLLSALPAYFRQSLAVMFQYRAEILLWAVWGVVYPAIAMAMWAAAVKGSPDGQTIRGYTPGDFAAYFWLTMVVGHACTAWDIYDMSALIRNGTMSARLLRPILPIWQSVADNLAYKVLTLTVLIPIWLIIIAIVEPSFDTTKQDFLYAVPAIAGAAVINYLWGYNLAILSFWFTRMDAIGQFWFGAGLFFGGRLAPMTLMPAPVQKIATALPFKWVTWFPCETMMGRLKPGFIQQGLINQLAWIAFGLVVFHVLWRMGVKRYSAVGA